MLNSNIISITSYCIYENDLLDYIPNEKLRHIPAKDDRGDFIGAYANACFKDGGYQFEILFKEQATLILTGWLKSEYFEGMVQKLVMGRLELSLDLHKLREEENKNDK